MRALSTRNDVLEAVKQAHKDCLARLDNLLRLKISPQNVDGSLLNDGEYASKKSDLLKEKATLEEKLGDTNQRVENWLDKAVDAFDFATNACYWFANGKLEKKRLIFLALGSNLVLKTKNCIFRFKSLIHSLSQPRKKILE